MSESRLYQVQRPLQLAADRTVPAGEIVDGTDWPPERIPRLIDQRYITPVLLVEREAVPARKEARGGRL